MPAHIVVGLGYGDEGKGAVTDHLVRSTGASKVVRYNGGAQAAHNVVLPNGTHHTFSQFGSGTLAGADTILSNHVRVNPHALFVEWEALRRIGFWPGGKITVQAGALVTTQLHVAANRIRETLRDENRHGSCGMGVGETVDLAQRGLMLTVEDLSSPKVTAKKLDEIQAFYYSMFREIVDFDSPDENAMKIIDTDFSKDLEVYKIFSTSVPLFEEFAFEPDEHVVFEGAQGVLLDEKHGFHPYTTWSDTTDFNAHKILSEIAYDEMVNTTGIIRSYMTRHGDGPFVTEDESLLDWLPERHNTHGEWQGGWRVGWTDLAALRYALVANDGVDALAVTHMDSIGGDWKICKSWAQTVTPPRSLDYESDEWRRDRMRALFQLDDAIDSADYQEYADMTPDRLIEEIESAVNVPVTITGYGPTYEGMINRVIA